MRRWGHLAAGAVLALTIAAPAAAQAPRATITSGPEASTEATTATFAFEISGFAPLGSLECALDGAAWSACESPFALEDLLGGPHRFRVRAVGALVNQTPAVHGWTVLEKSQTLPPPASPPKVDPPPPPVPPRSPVPRDAGGCDFAANRPGEVGAAALARGITCRINAVRRERGLRPLRRVRALDRAATFHARDMVRRRYFAHTSADGSTVRRRVGRTGYLRGRRAWRIGEVIAWGTGSLATPRSIVARWMRSPGHRRVLVDGGYRDLGVGLAPGIPLRGRRDGGTFVAELGRR